MGSFELIKYGGSSADSDAAIATSRIKTDFLPCRASGTLHLKEATQSIFDVRQVQCGKHCFYWWITGNRTLSSPQWRYPANPWCIR